MISGSFRFDRFTLDPAERQLRLGEAPVELNGRYLDALTLLVREEGRLVSKDRFLEEVWRGVPVTDEALTQCIRTLRRQLGDDAAAPRFIETVPKHGYRFIAPVQAVTERPVDAIDGSTSSLVSEGALRLGLAGTFGGALAGAVGGLFYGFAAATQPGTGALSALLVLLCITMIMALIGAAGVAFGIAMSGFSAGRPLQLNVAGGALGGLLVGAIVKLLGLDTFELLLGHSPGDITGPFEGVVLGGAVGVGVWLAGRSRSLRRGLALAALSGGSAGLLIPLLGGKLMGGSLALLAQAFPNSRLRMDHVGYLFGEAGFGRLSQLISGVFEGALFAACIAGAMVLARRRPASEV